MSYDDKSGEKKFLHSTINMIKTLWTTTHGVVVHKQKFDILTFIGRVTSVNDASTKCVYFVEDGTDGINVLQWKGGDDGKAKTLSEAIAVGTFVQCHGQLRQQSSDLNFVAFKVIPIKDFNEVTKHLMEVVHDNLLLRKHKFLYAATRGEPTGNGLMPGLSSGNDGVTPMDVSDIGSNFPTGMNRAQTMILETLKKCQQEEGMSKDELKRCLPSLDQATLQGSLDWLSNEGHVFSTIDENHFQSAY